MVEALLFTNPPTNDNYKFSTKHTQKNNNVKAVKSDQTGEN